MACRPRALTNPTTIDIDSDMAEIQPLRGLRYNLGHVGSLGDVVAPPYDVIDEEFCDQLYKRHPANVIRLILNRQEPGDDEESNQYTRAAMYLKNWQQEGVLEAEPHPALYVYHQVFEKEGREVTRAGFMCRVRLQRFGEGNIYAHEETHSAAKEDRLKLIRACKSNLSQIFGLYPDDQSTVQNTLESGVSWQNPVQATDHLGVVHQIWPVTDIGLISTVNKELTDRPIFIADGHHRYETACNYRDELEKSIGPLPDDHPAHYVLMMCVGMSDPGMIVLPTHRLFHGVPEFDSDELVSRLDDCFTCSIAGEGSDLAEGIWNQIEDEGDQGIIGLYTAKDDRWVLAKITEAGRQKLKQVAADRSEDWRELGVSILHRLIIDTLLDVANHPTPTYVRLVEDLVAGIDSGEAPLAALVMPASLEHIRTISEHGERMPAKSTYFYPKLLSGLVINALS